MLRKQLHDVQVELRRLRQMVHDMGGGNVKFVDDPYEDEAPLVVWEDDK